MYKNDRITNGPALKQGISTKFNTALEACGVCGIWFIFTSNNSLQTQMNMDARIYMAGDTLVGANGKTSQCKK